MSHAEKQQSDLQRIRDILDGKIVKAMKFTKEDTVTEEPLETPPLPILKQVGNEVLLEVEAGDAEAECRVEECLNSATRRCETELSVFGWMYGGCGKYVCSEHSQDRWVPLVVAG